ncbi:MAG: class I SAM-dependent methyltransferase [Patescibacteria group bacterium]|nr:class I SAM-dependent methyltransferase [Patescibacteria group bacterium]
MIDINTLPEGWLDQEEADLLLKWAEKTKGPIVEIGSYKGRSAALLAGLNRWLICVDSWQDYEGQKGEEIYKTFLENTKGYLNIEPVRCRAEDWQPVESEFVYIDGDHSFEGTKAAIEKALQCHPKYIAGHDYYRTSDGLNVMKAFDQFFARPVAQAGKMAIFQL